MARVLTAWELGDGYGHLGAMQPLVVALLAAGHDVTVAARDLTHAERLFAGTGARLAQAPYAPLAPASRAGPPATYAGMLLRSGLRDVHQSAGLARAWRTLFEALDVDAVVCDHAPLALLAAVGTRVGTAIWGTGFCCPPPLPELPTLQLFASDDGAVAGRDRAEALICANAVLARLDSPGLDTLGDLYAGDVTLLTTYAELDPFAAERRGARYLGADPCPLPGVAPRWPPSGKQRVFAYLKREMQGLEALLVALAGGPYATLAHLPGAPSAVVERFASPHLRIETEPVDLASLAGQCDAGLCPAGHGTLVSLLAGGLPMLLAPTHGEQLMNALAAQRAGVGIVVVPAVRAPNYAVLMDRLLGDASLRNAARQLAPRFAAYDAGAANNEMAELIAGVAVSSA